MSTSSKPALKPKPQVSAKPRHLSVSPPGKPPVKPKPPIAARKPSISLAAKPKIAPLQPASVSFSSVDNVVNSRGGTAAVEVATKDIVDEEVLGCDGSNLDGSDTGIEYQDADTTDRSSSPASSAEEPIVEDSDQGSDTGTPATDDANLRHRGNPYTAADWRGGFDADGRAGDEWKFKKAVFLGV